MAINCQSIPFIDDQLCSGVFTPNLRDRCRLAFPARDDGTRWLDVRSAETAFSDLYASAGWQDHVNEGDLFQVGNDFSWFVSESCLRAPLAKGFPAHIGEKANQNMSLHAVPKMVPDRAQGRIAFVDAECGFGQLYVSMAEYG